MGPPRTQCGATINSLQPHKVLRVSLRFIVSLLFIGVLLVSAGTIILTNVESEPVIALSSGSARIGSQISISGTGFLPTDTTCSLSSPSSAGLLTSGACVVRGGSLYGGFTVGNVMPGAYLIQASGNQGDYAQTILQVSGGAQIGLSPATGQPGAQVSVEATGFLPTDTTCTISSPTQNVVLTGTAACVIQSGSGTPHGGFTIGNVLPGEYVIQITGNQGDSAQAILAVE